MLEFLLLVGRLKRIPRTGWVYKHIPNPESISDHMYRLGILSMLFKSDPSVNVSRMIELSLVHDLAESIAGDITPHDNVSSEEKHALEKAAMDEICRAIPEPALQDYFKACWLEYENNASPEAELVHQMDKLEMLIQAYEYETLDQADCTEFFTSARHKIKHPKLTAILHNIEQRRKPSLK